MVEVLVSDVQLRQELWEGHLRAVPDLARLARKLQRSKGTLQVWKECEGVRKGGLKSVVIVIVGDIG